MNTHQDLVMTLNQLKQEFTIQRRQLLLLQNNLKQIHTRTLSQTKVLVDMKKNKTDRTTFGFKEVDPEKKADLVGEVFDTVSNNYDLMNDLMSLGIHRLWKQVAIQMSGVRSGHKVLDIAGGTGDLAAKFSRIVGPTG